MFAVVVGWYLHLSVVLGLVDNVAGFICIESTVLGESIGESQVGQAMVRRVIFNRSASTGDHPCVVVSRRQQFDGFDLRNMLHFSGQYWRQQLFVRKFGCGLATHFHAAWDKPRWSRSNKMQRLCRIGGHIFYLEKQK